MSDEEKAAAIGRLVMERSEAKREQALLQHELSGVGEKLGALGNHLRGVVPAAPDLRTCRQILTTLIEENTLARTKDAVARLETLSAKIPDLDQKLKEAGVV